MKLVLVHLNKSLCQPGSKNNTFLYVGIYFCRGWGERMGFSIMMLLACGKVWSSFKLASIHIMRFLVIPKLLHIIITCKHTINCNGMLAY